MRCAWAARTRGVPCRQGDHTLFQMGWRDGWEAGQVDNRVSLQHARRQGTADTLAHRRSPSTQRRPNR